MLGVAQFLWIVQAHAIDIGFHHGGDISTNLRIWYYRAFCLVVVGF